MNRGRTVRPREAIGGEPVPHHAPRGREQGLGRRLREQSADQPGEKIAAAAAREHGSAEEAVINLLAAAHASHRSLEHDGCAGLAGERGQLGVPGDSRILARVRRKHARAAARPHEVRLQCVGIEGDRHRRVFHDARGQRERFGGASKAGTSHERRRTRDAGAEQMLAFQREPAVGRFRPTNPHGLRRPSGERGDE